MRALSASDARRLALAAQGFCDRRPAGRVDRRHLRRTLGRLGAIQIDSVNVLVRSHYLPAWSRLGAYPAALLDRAAYEHRDAFEYWGHEASFLPVEVHHLFRWRMARAARGETWESVARIARERPGFVEDVYAEVAARGPLRAAELSENGARREPWWGLPDGKQALEHLFWAGRVAAAGRRNFERLYDVTERVIPAAALARPTPPEDEAIRALLRLSGRALGVATAADLADYFRIRPGLARPRLAEVVEEGSLVPVEVEGWRHPAYLDPEARLPRRVEAATLLSPFDSLVWARDRTERLFGFRYRLEIYIPAPKRVHGYYVLPFLLGDRLVARVDLKADRRAGVLRVPAAWLEDGEPAAGVAAALAGTLMSLAGWLDLSGVEVPPHAAGDLAETLRRAVAGTGGP